MHCVELLGRAVASEGHVEYTIQLISAGQENFVIRRYREFEALHKRVRRRFTELPPLPPKHPFGKYASQDFLDRRERGLGALLSAMLEADPYLSDPDLSTFLGLRPPTAEGGPTMGMPANTRVQYDEDADLQRAIRVSQNEEDRRIVQEQDREVEESLAVDRAREEAEKLKRQEEEQEREREAAEKRRQAKDAAAAAEALVAKRERLPPEPLAGEAGRLMLAFRLPSGRRRQRAFSQRDRVGSLYDFVDVEEERLASEPYHLVTHVPKMVFSDRDATLEDAGVQNQAVLLVEMD
mmetsp:Transcript_62105/g.110808  ORF Transcript_62105/g.110808 Transcript_62105/m.110808 type:complete len:294 (+) Transcript_62105:81-962(+)